MRYRSVCSGIEGATVAWEPLGFKAVSFAEVDPFCKALLKHHYPEVENVGDFTQDESTESADILVGGTPCQDFSVAGLRAGMAGDRGNLTLEFLRTAGRTRPRWVVWENVPGILSSNGGRDFGSFLGGLGKLGYGFAYRILDAQHFGVPQRRRRVFVVGHLGDWRLAAAVLFEQHCLSGNPAPSRKAGEGLTRSFESSSWGGGGETDVAPTLDARCKDGAMRNQTSLSVVGSLCADAHPGAYSGQDAYTGRLIAHSLRADGFDASEDGTGRGTPIVVDMQASKGNCNVSRDNVSPTLSGMHGHDVHAFATLVSNGDAHSGFRDEQGLVATGGSNGNAKEAHAREVLQALREAIGEKAFCEWGLGVLDSLQSSEVLRSEVHGRGIRRETNEARCGLDDRALSRAEGNTETALPEMWATGRARRSPQGRELSEQLAKQLDSLVQKLSHEDSQTKEILRGMRQASEGIGLLQQALSPVQGTRENHNPLMAVRRLTPRECERLMGFPDDYTAIPYRGKIAADGPRYKALGNSWAVPVVRWIGERIKLTEVE